MRDVAIAIFVLFILTMLAAGWHDRIANEAISQAMEFR